MREPFFSKGRWIYRVERDDGIEKTFTSIKEGMAGKRAVMKSARRWLDGTYKRSGGRVKEYWPSFLSYYKNIHGRETEAYRLYKQIGETYILPNLGRLKVDDLRFKVLQNFLFDLRLKNGNMPSKKTYGVIRATLNQFIRYMAVVEEVCEPFALSLLTPPQATEKKERLILQPNDVKRLFNMDETDSHYAYAFQFCLVTGLRPGELVGLKKSDVDLNRNTISVVRSINERGIITSGKNKNANRTFVLNEIAREIVNKQLKFINNLKSEWLFPDEYGHFTMQIPLKKEYWRLDLPGTVYCLRHTFVSLMKYINLSSIKRTIGHSESMPTLEIYSHVIEGEQESDAEIIGNELHRRLGI